VRKQEQRQECIKIKAVRCVPSLNVDERFRRLVTLLLGAEPSDGEEESGQARYDV
jgi:hypothetical protein